MSGASTTRVPDAGHGSVVVRDRPGNGGFRPDIQGLRAVAVLVVVGAHAGLVPLAGGFVGVDVFFVVSGFLISRLLFLEAARTGRISLARFYARRARRILPAATVVTLVTLGVSAWWLSVVDALEVVYDALWATFFVANLRFADRGVDYFAAAEGPSPLQHYWSLAVEEQFYLVWPLVLIGCLAWVRRRGGPGRLPRLPLLGALALLSAVSFGYASVLTRTEPVAAYFSTAARIWELGVGAIAALIAPALAQRMGTRLRGLLASTGLGLIAVSCLEFGAETPFPGSAALLPVLGAGLILLGGAGGQGPRPWSLRLLAVRPLRTIGDWSYSLYLWHWPVLLLLPELLGRDLSPAETAGAVGLVFGLSVATYRLVEQPFRRRRPASARRSLLLYPVAVAMLAGACAGGWQYLQWRGGEHGDNPAVTLTDYSVPVGGTNRDVDRTIALVRASAIAAREGRPVPSDLTPDLLDLRDDIPDMGACVYAAEVRALCPRGDAEAERTVVVLGNSHARAWIPALDRIGEQQGWRMLYLVLPRCPTVGLVVANVPDAEPWQTCVEFNQWSLQQVERLSPEVVLVATSARLTGVYLDGEYLSGDAAVEAGLRTGYRRLFARLKEAADRVVLMRDVPYAGEDLSACLSSGRPDLGDCAYQPDERADRRAELSAAAARAAGLDVVDPTPWLCWRGTCPAVVGSTVVYRDAEHLTATYAARLAEPLGRALALSD